MPNKVRVTGEVPQGHYSRKQLSQLKVELHERLYGELEKKVAMIHRGPGRSARDEVDTELIDAGTFSAPPSSW